MKNLPLALGLFGSFLICDVAPANVEPNPLFSTGAVLQRRMPLPVWGRADEGEKVTVRFDGETGTCIARDGVWKVLLKPHEAGGPYTLTIEGKNTVTVEDVYVGEVWICSGQSNMAFNLGMAAEGPKEAPLAGFPQLRLFAVERKTAVKPSDRTSGRWTECTPKTVSAFSAVAYFFGRDLYKALGIPVGLISSSWPGTPAQSWISLDGLKKTSDFPEYVTFAEAQIARYAEAASSYPQKMKDYEALMTQWNSEVGNAYAEEVKAWQAKNKEASSPLPKPTPSRPMPKVPVSPDGDSSYPTALYNGMIAPIIPYAIKGVIWYQGESNAKKAKEYQKLFPRLIADWREKWGQGPFPFLFVQIAPYRDQPPEIREAQLLTWQNTEHTAMVVTMDVGDPNDIHPKRKEPVGQRLALAARAVAYGQDLEYSGPVFRSADFSKGRATLHFTHVGSGLAAGAGALTGFQLAGRDGVYFDARAEIVGETVVVASEQVPEPASVRYGWANTPEGSLFNKEGLPASPFRSDIPK